MSASSTLPSTVSQCSASAQAVTAAIPMVTKHMPRKYITRDSSINLCQRLIAFIQVASQSDEAHKRRFGSSQITSCRRKAIYAALLVALSAVALSGHSRMAVAKDGLTNHEYLEFYFRLKLHLHQSDSLISFNVVRFLPGKSSDEHILLIIQTYNTNGMSSSSSILREGIRQVGYTFIESLDSSLRSPTLKQRWSSQNPAANLIVKHVRVEDLQDTLAVTIDGATHFDPQAIQRAEHRVKQNGGVWEF